MKQKKFQPLFIFYTLVGYVLLQFCWWSFLLIKQNNEIYSLKQHLNLFEYHDPQLIIEKGNTLETQLHYKWMMIAGEAFVFFLLLILFFVRVRNTFKREEELLIRQKNFIHSVTHELKSPIASGKLSLETLLKHELGREKQKEIISNALTDIDRLTTLVENILFTARIDHSLIQLHTERVNLSEYMEESIRKARINFQCKQSIQSAIQPHLFLEVDKTLFPSIFLNLFENAIHYSPDHSTITISLHEQGNNIVLSFADEGTGISKEERKHIFKQFYRLGNEVTRKTKGTGLGLYIVNYLVEKHRASISVKNNLPKGSIFEVVFTKQL
jgi:two-component system, OmpR family, phosphate regulon sensor histidine kinase PhoR